MALEQPASIAPKKYRIVLAMHLQDQALRCEQLLNEAGYNVTLCSGEITASQVIEAVESQRPHLLVVEGDIEWAESVHVVLRLHADPAFATLAAIVLPDRCCVFPTWNWHDTSDSLCYLSKPFDDRELLWMIRRVFQQVEARERPFQPVEIPEPSRTSFEWEIWKRRLPPIALFEAVEYGDYPRAEALIADGADVCSQDNRGWSLLHYAVVNRHPHLVQLLVQNGADVNVVDAEGATPLQHALKRYTCLERRAEVGRLLMQSGDEPNVANKLGK